MATGQQMASGRNPASQERIEVHVAELRQLFNAMDPSPFRERDLDPNAEEFIVGWAREAPRDRPLALVVHLDRPAALEDEAELLRAAIEDYFTYRAEVTRRRLRELFRLGRTSLLIGLAALGLSLLGSDLVGSAAGDGGFAGLLQESLIIGGWVAMWRPIEIFLYEWWPLRAEARLYVRLSAMPVSIIYSGHAPADAWRRDRPSSGRT